MEVESAELLAEKTGWAAPYWRSEWEEKTYPEHWAAVEAAQDAGALEEEEREQKECAALRAFFLRCGFTYSDAMQAPQLAPRVAFANLGRHTLTSAAHPELTARLNEGELSALLERIGEVVELAIWKKSKG